MGISSFDVIRVLQNQYPEGTKIGHGGTLDPRAEGVLVIAVGIIMGGAITKLVTSIVDNLLNPLIGAVTGAAGNLSALAYTIPMTQITFKYGAFISSLIDFVAVLAVVYFVFVKSPINKIDKKSE